MWKILVLFSIISVGYFFFKDNSEVNRVEGLVKNLLKFNQINYRPGILITTEPIQRPSGGQAIIKDKYTLQPVAVFAMRGRVLATERYWFDREASLVPRDFVLGWREMSDQTYVDKVSFSQGLRHYSYDYDSGGLRVRTISYNSANMHLIPGNPSVETVLENLKTGDIIAFSGYLVNAQGQDNWIWRTSLTRDDIGKNSGELVLVNNLEVITNNYPRVE